MASLSLSASISLFPSNSTVLMLGRSRTRKRRVTPPVAAGEVGLDVVEEAGVPQRAHVAGEALHLEGLPRLLPEIGEDVVFGHAAVAAHVDGGDGLPLGLLPFGQRKMHLRLPHARGDVERVAQTVAVGSCRAARSCRVGRPAGSRPYAGIGPPRRRRIRELPRLRSSLHGRRGRTPERRDEAHARHREHLPSAPALRPPPS